MIQPPSGQANTGWVKSEKPPFRFMNYLFNVLDGWTQWLDYYTGLLSQYPGVAGGNCTGFTSTDLNITIANNGQVISVQPTVGTNLNINLPVATNGGGNAGLVFTLNDVLGLMDENTTVTLVRFDGVNDYIENVGANYVLSAKYGSWTIVCIGGSRWQLI